jgi:hypothetical protein
MLNFAWTPMATSPLPLSSEAEGGGVQQDAQVAALRDGGLERLEVGLDGGNLLLVACEVEQGLGVASAHIRYLGVVGQLIPTRRLRFHLPQATRSPRPKGLKALDKGALGSTDQKSPRPKAARVLACDLVRRNRRGGGGRKGRIERKKSPPAGAGGPG